MKGYVSTPAGQIHFAEEGSGASIILLHRYPSSSAMYAELLPRLARRGYRVIAYDLPGYGMSDAPTAEPDLAYYAARIIDAAERMGVARFDVVGHHSGCSIAMAIGIRYPEHVRRIIGYGVPFLDAERARALATEEPPCYGAMGMDGARTVLVATWKRLLNHTELPDSGRLAAREIGQMLLSGECKPYAHRAVGNADHESMAEALSVPMLAVAGRRDVLYEASKRAAMTSRWITFAEIEDAGLFVVDEFPEELADLIDGFVSEKSSIDWRTHFQQNNHVEGEAVSGEIARATSQPSRQETGV